MNDNMPYPPQGKDSRKKEQLLTCCRGKKVSLLEIPDFSSNQAVFLFEGEEGGEGEKGMLVLAVNACARECTVASTSRQPHQQRRGD